MNNLSKLGAQLLEIWRQLGVSQRISVLAATLVLVAGLGTSATIAFQRHYGKADADQRCQAPGP